MNGFTKLGSFLNLRAKVEKAAKAGLVVISRRGLETHYDLTGYRIVVTEASTTLWQANALTPLRQPNDGLREVEQQLKHLCCKAA